MTDVWNTVDNMWKLGASIGAFFEVLESELGNGKPLMGAGGQSAGRNKYTRRGWCCYTDYRRYGLQRIKPETERYNQCGNLTVGVELWREVNDSADAWHLAKEPLIYVGFTPGTTPENFWGQEMGLDYLGAPLPSGEVGETVAPTETAPWLWWWDEDNPQTPWDQRNWFFVLRLFDIDSREAAQKEIIDPLGSLLAGNNPSAAFANRRAIQNVG